MVLVPFELRPDMPLQGLQVSVREAGGHSDRVEDHLTRIAARDGFPFVSPPFVPHTHLALSLGEFARDHGEAAHLAAHAAIFGAYFGDGRDIGRRDVLLQVAAGSGFDRAKVEEAWDTHRFDDRLHRFRHVATGLGLESTPAAVICNELLIGSRPYEVLKKSMERCLLTAENVGAQAGRA